MIEGLQMEPYRRKDASKQTWESSGRRMNQVVAATLAFESMIKGRASEESIGSIAASGSRTGEFSTTTRASFSPLTDDAASPEPPDLPPFSFPDLGFDGDDLYLFQSSSPRMQTLRHSRWRIVKHVIIAALRFLSLRPPPRSMPIPNLPDWELISIVAKDESSGTVYEAVHRSTGQNYALMEIPYDSSHRQEISREVDILKELEHPNLVKCYDVVVFADAGRIFLILEPLDGSLVGVSITSQSDFVSLSRQLLLGLTCLHRNKIAHGDIKPSNIFFNHSGQIKLLYLGKTLSSTPTFLTETEIGAIHDGFSWDIWSVGLCILKLSEGLSCSYRDEDIMMGSESSQNEGALVWNRELLRLLISCMQTDVLKRWTAQQLVHHPFFDQLPLNRENDLFHEVEEIMSPIKKKSKISMEDEDRVYDLESSKDDVVPERCIEHCKLFIPDCEFDKDKLVRMWIAEECIELGATNKMEDVGNLYFDALVHEEVIVSSKFDNLHRQMKYKFNTSQVLDGLLKQGNYVRINSSNLDEIYRDALHLTWQCKRLDRTLFDALKNLKQLHTLVVHEDCSASISQLPNDIFLGLQLLRTLDLSCSHIAELPGSIGKLESLRYLDISETPIKRLPESLDRLCCLQTLNLKACFGLFALPRGLGRLVNLRHLDLDIVSQLKSMPRGMGNLIKLQTLRAFIVGKNDGCSIGELKNMNEITGSFCISRLENVSNAEEAKEAALSDKKYIDKLELRWHNGGNDNFQDTSEILESLQPHFHLKELQLTFYGGSKLPSWISNPFYTDLASITLYKCINCDIMPSIGELPSLKILHIVDMENVRNINTVFCRNHETKMLNAFPRLEKLTLDSMLALEEWTGVEDGDFPCLGHVSIRYCPKLRVLPSLSHLHSLEHLEISHCMQLISLPEGLLPRSLESLIIRGCPELNERCRKDGGLDCSKIASVTNVWIDLEKISLDLD